MDEHVELIESRLDRHTHGEETAPATGTGFDELYRAQFPRLVRSAYLLTGSLADAEDAAQDAFAALHRRRPPITDPDQARAYLHVVTVNRTRGLWRRVTYQAALKDRLRAQNPPTAPDPAATVEGADPRTDALLLALSRLPRRQRQVMVLRYWADLSERQIAAALGVRPGTVKTAAARAHHTLVRALGEDPS